jgi:RNA polymerase primary sigma factor
MHPEVSHYMTEVSQFPVLDEAAERELALRVFRGDDLESRDGREARNAMAQANLRLVVKIAREMTGLGIELGDLIMEGNLGLLRSIESFDPSRGVRFQTYAAPWIKQSMNGVIRAKSRMIRTPRSRQSEIEKWMAASEKMADELGRPPTTEEVGRSLGMGKTVATRVAELATNGRTAKVLGLDHADYDADSGADSPIDVVVRNEQVSAVLARMHKLTERESRIIRMRFGMDPFAGPMSLEAIGEVMGLEKSSIARIEKVAFGKLSHNGG